MYIVHQRTFNYFHLSSIIKEILHSKIIIVIALKVKFQASVEKEFMYRSQCLRHSAINR